MKQYLFFITILILLSPIGVFGSDEEALETIREKQESIHSLEKQKQELDFKWNTFFIGQEGIGNLFRPVSQNETEQIRTIVQKYERDIQKLNTNIEVNVQRGNNVKDLRSELYSLKEEFYSDIEVYVLEEKYEEFITYRDSDIAYRVRSSDVSVSIAKKDEEKQERIEELQESASYNAENSIRVKFSELELKVEQRLNEFTQTEDFKSLSIEVKTAVFQNMIDKFRDAKNKLEAKTQVTTIVEEKILLFENIINILEGYITSWSE